MANLRAKPAGLHINGISAIAYRILLAEKCPRWLFDDETFECSAHAFDNPDFVSVVIHS